MAPARTRRVPIGDPHAMSTTRASNIRDPPQTTTNVVGFKRIRKNIAVSNTGIGSLTVGDVTSCLPFAAGNTQFRILKFSIWGPDSDGDNLVAPLTCVFPISNAAALTFTGTPGDNSAWTDEGVQGQSRPQIHLTPAFDYRNYWLSSTLNGPAAFIATFSTSISNHVIIDLSIQYRTTVQSCPAMDHLTSLRGKEI
jgi:hypothetical protein